MRRTGGGLLVLALLWGVAHAAPAMAASDDVQRVEAVGAFPIGTKRSAGVPPRDGAVRAAVGRSLRYASRLSASDCNSVSSQCWDGIACMA